MGIDSCSQIIFRATLGALLDQMVAYNDFKNCPPGQKQKNRF